MPTLYSQQMATIYSQQMPTLYSQQMATIYSQQMATLYSQQMATLGFDGHNSITAIPNNHRSISQISKWRRICKFFHFGDRTELVQNGYLVISYDFNIYVTVISERRKKTLNIYKIIRLAGEFLLI